MAHQRVNTTFVIALSAVLVVMAAGVGAAYFLLQTSAEEHFAAGEEAFAAGDYREAKRAFGDAVSEAPSNTQYLERYRDTLKLIPVDTITRARETQNQYHQTMRQLVDKGADEAAFTELMDWYFGQGGGFREAHTVSSTVLQREPEHLQARRTRGYIAARYADTYGASSQSQVEEDIAFALAADPNDGRSQFAQALWRLEQARRIAETGLRDSAEETRREAVALAMQMLAVDPTDLDRLRWATEITRRSALVKQRLVVAPKLLARTEAAAAAIVGDPDETQRLLEIAFELRAGDRLPVSLGGPDGLVYRGLIRARDLIAAAVEQRPDDLLLGWELARLQETSGDLEAASASYNALLSASETDVPFERYLQASGLASRARYERTRLQLRRAMEDESMRDEAIAAAAQAQEALQVELGSADAPELHHLRGLVAMLEGRDADALFDLDKAVIATQLADAQVLKDAAEAATRAGRTALAMSWLERYVQLNPADVIRRIGLGELYLREAKAGSPVRDYYLAAEDQARVLNELAPRLLAGRWLAARVVAARAEQANDPAGYLEAVRAIKGPDDELDLLQLAEVQPQIFNEVATWLSRGGQVDAARDMRRMRHEAAPEDADNAYRYGILFEDEAKRLEIIAATEAAGVEGATLDRLRTALMNPEDLATLSPAATLSPRDLRAREMQAAATTQDWAEATQIADELIASDPADDEAWSYKLQAAVATESETTADAVARAAEQAIGGRAAESLWRGRLALYNQDYNRAETLIRRAVDADATNARAQADLGNALLGQGRAQDAVKAYEESIRYAEGDALRPAYLGLIAVHSRTGDWDRVLATLRAMDQRRLFVQINEMLQYVAVEQAHGDPERAQAMRVGLVERFPQLYALRRQIAAVQAEDGDLDAARSTVQAVIEDEGETLDSVMALATIDRLGEDPEAGVARLEAFAATHGVETQGLAYVALAQYLIQAGDGDRALAAYQQGIAIEPAETRLVSLALAEQYVSVGQHAQAAPILTELHEAFPENERITALAIESLLNTGAFDEAVTLADKLPAEAPGRAITRAAVYRARGDAASAIDVLTTEIDRDTAGRQAMSRLHESRAAARWDVLRGFGLDTESPDGQSAFAAAMQEIESDLDAAVVYDSNNFGARVLQAEAMAQRGNASRARQMLRDAVNDSNGSISVRRRFVQLLASEGDLSAAISEAQAGLDAAEGNIGWLRTLADLHQRNGNPREMLRFARQAAAATDAPQDVMQAATAAISAGEPTAVLELADAYPALFTETPRLQGMRAQALVATGNPDGARNVFSNAAKAAQTPSAFVDLISAAARTLGPDAAAAISLDASDQPASWRDFAAAQLAMNSGDLDQAIALTRPIVADAEADPQLRGPAASVLGIALQTQGDAPGARDAYEVALEISPNNWQTLNNLAYLLLIDLNDPESALPMAERASQSSNGRNPSVQDTYGLALLRAGRLRDARVVLQGVVRDAPDLASGHLHLGEVYLAEGDRRAIATINRALDVAVRTDDTETATRAQALIDQSVSP